MRSATTIADRRHFRALLTGSAEGIASNILADPLKRLIDSGNLTRGAAGRGQRARCSLTEAGIRTLPILIARGDWGLDWRPGGAESQSRQHLIREGGDASVSELMDELRVRHLDLTPRDDPGPFVRLETPGSDPGVLWDDPATD